MEQIGIVGAGTMGAGIALTALYRGLRVVLYDIDSAARQRAQAYAAEFLAKKNQETALERLHLTDELADLAACDLIIEAIVENLASKQNLFAQLEALCPPTTILATNTSTIPVSAIATGLQHPQRMVGMHFFNPAPVMRLVEVIQAAQSAETALHQVVQWAAKLGKKAILVQDSPGFVVNRVARPFYLEALRILSAGKLTPQQIDDAMHYGANFRMGPFRLMDLIGLDINLAASQSVYEQTQAPHLMPSPLQAQLVSEGRLGRKTGRGFYDYGEDAPTLIPPLLPDATPQHGEITALGTTTLAHRAAKHGYTLVQTPSPLAIVDHQHPLPNEGLILVDYAAGIAPAPHIIQFDDCLVEGSRLITLLENPALSPSQRHQIQAFLHGIGLGILWLPHMVISRIVCQLMEEARWVVEAGIATPEDVDSAMLLGANYPLGLFAWRENMGEGRIAKIVGK